MPGEFDKSVSQNMRGQLESNGHQPEASSQQPQTDHLSLFPLTSTMTSRAANVWAYVGPSGP